jgi:tetratricopeptide (TPR) repeat protein
MGKAYKKLRELEKAEADFAHAKQMEYDAVLRSDIETKDLDEKIKRTSEAIKIHPNYISAWEKRYSTLLDANDFKNAVKVFTVLIHIKDNPNLASAYNNRARCYYYLYQYIKSLHDCNKAISLDPTIHEAYKTRAWIYHLFGETEKGLADHEKVYEFCPDDVWTIKDPGKLYEETGGYEKAVELRTWIFCHFAYSNSSFIFLVGSQSYNGPVIRKLTAVLENDSGNAAVYFIRGKAHDENSRFDNAVADYTKAINLKADFLIAYVYRTETYSGLQR